LLAYFSSRIARDILQKQKDVYTTTEIDKLNKVGISPFRKVTPCDTNNFAVANIASNNKDLPNVSFFLDFQEYWLKPLAKVFNISIEELKQTAIRIVVKEWGVTPDDRFIRDPRNYAHKETHSRHTSIPPTQPFDFYLGYHSIFTMASRLLKKMPVVKNENDWDDDRWTEWLSNYLLSMNSGYFRSDLRDPAPFIRRKWLLEKSSDMWKWEIENKDFLEGLLLNVNNKTFICVNGYWSDNDGNQRKEDYHVCSALVTTKNSSSLLRALISCNSSQDYKLPLHSESEFELADPEFTLKGWLVEPNNYKKIDEVDPYAGELIFPIGKISEEHERLLNLDYCTLTKSYIDSAGECQGFSQTWTQTHSKNPLEYSPIREGNRLFISLDKLKDLCAKTELSLIFEITIKRQISTTDKDIPDNVKYPRPYCNLYTLTKDGVIEDYKARGYQLR
jgi:hypothetical protein